MQLLFVAAPCLALLAALVTAAQDGAPEAPPAVIGHANGVKIGEVTPDAAVLWTRLTACEAPLDPLLEWPNEPPAPDALPWRVPGATGEVRFVLWPAADPDAKRTTPWHPVGPDTDSCHQVPITGLSPATPYRFEAQGRAGTSRSSFPGSFTTAPAPDDDRPVTLVVSTCQDFHLRDDPALGHTIYHSMLALEPDLFLQTGDTLYYDRARPFAKDPATARHKWNRMYALPNLVAFHAQVPTAWMHDDHDLLKDDCWPGQHYGDLTWDQGLAIWREQVPTSPHPYRTFRWGRHVQIWLPEGREFRSPNTTPDGPTKTILGPTQWRWLEDSLRTSDAPLKLYISATPVVGPDRPAKNDNHANAGFEHEGKRLRALLASVPGVIVINGDRHWQYHSIDPETGLQEFGCGPASDAHAGGFRKELQERWQPFLRVRGGALSISADDGARVVRHRPRHGDAVQLARFASHRDRWGDCAVDGPSCQDCCRLSFNQAGETTTTLTAGKPQGVLWADSPPQTREP